VLGGLLALLSATTFAITNAAVRRGVLSGSAVQATTLSIPVGVPLFFLALCLGGSPGAFAALPRDSIIAFAVTGVSHFIVGRYANYRAIGAIGTNLAGPVMQFNLVVSLVLAIAFLGETLTPLRILGILLIFIGPVVVTRRGARAERAGRHLAFTPRMAEGYAFAALAALCYGATPVLLRYAGGGRGLEPALAGGVISAATASVVVALLLFAPGHWREIRAVNAQAAKWFLFSAVMVYVSQIFYYMALSLAPVTIIAPISALSNVFRIHVSRWLNPEHEVFGPEVIIATAVSFLGVIVLSASADALPVPASWAALLSWHWP
jgi:drug/metabolite transporter (DMT)-like permease